MRASEILDYATRKKLPTPRESNFIYSHSSFEERKTFREAHKLYKLTVGKNGKDNI